MNAIKAYEKAIAELSEARSNPMAHDSELFDFEETAAEAWENLPYPIQEKIRNKRGQFNSQRDKR